MLSPRSLIVAAALGACGFGLAPSLASAQAAGPSNALQYTFQSIDELRDEARAQAGWHKSHWQCQPAGPCAWVAGFWGPPPASPPPGAYVFVRPSVSGLERLLSELIGPAGAGRAAIWERRIPAG